MSLTVGELMEHLEDRDPESEVRFASQVNWPFEYSIAGVVAGDDLSKSSDVQAKCLYLVEGTQLGYFTKEAWDDV